MSDRICPNCKGTGRLPALPSANAVTSYMLATGWTPDPDGPAGALWKRGDRAIAVFRDMEPGFMEWSAVIERLAWAENTTGNEIIDRIAASQEASDV